MQLYFLLHLLSVVLSQLISVLLRLFIKLGEVGLVRGLQLGQRLFQSLVLLFQQKFVMLPFLNTFLIEHNLLLHLINLNIDLLVKPSQLPVSLALLPPFYEGLLQFPLSQLPEPVGHLPHYF